VFRVPSFDPSSLKTSWITVRDARTFPVGSWEDPPGAPSRSRRRKGPGAFYLGITGMTFLGWTEDD
jgi:hypothetical protein